MFLRSKFLFIAVVFALLLIPYRVLAGTTQDSFSRTFIGAYSYVDANGHYGNFEHFTKGDGATAYCIEPGVSLYTGTYNGSYDLSLSEMASKVSLTPTQLNTISLYAYFGYGYGNHTGNDWIVATQAAIWEALGLSFQFTSRYDQPKSTIPTPSEITSHVNEIKSLTNNFLSAPSFNTTHAKIAYKRSYNFGSLNGYSVTNCENCTFSTSGNQLVVTPNGKQSGSISLIKEAKGYNGSFIVYYSNNGQNMIVPGNISSSSTELSFEVVTGDIKIIKYDQDNKTCNPKEGGSLEGSIYKLYKDDGTFVSDLVIGSDCSASVHDLELGTYYVKEYKAGLNYELDPNSYYIDLTISNPSKTQIVYDKMYVGQVKLMKLDGDSKTCESSSIYATLKGAVYGIYKKDGELLYTLTIDEKCSALSKRNLLLGDYYLQEIKAPKGYKYNDKKYYFSVTKENADGLITIDAMDEIYKTKVIINKSFLYFQDIQPEVGAVFEIYYQSTMEKVATLAIDKDGISSVVLPYGEYIIKQVSGKTGYHFVEDISLVVDEKTDSKTVLTLLNKPYRGTLEFSKIDLNTGKFLSNVLIEIYNEKDELVYRGLTDDEGKIIVENLAYGKYYIVEKKALEGYYLFEDRLYFEIKEDKEIVRVSMENEQIVRVPDTSKSSINEQIVFAFVFLLSGIGLILHGKEKI